MQGLYPQNREARYLDRLTPGKRGSRQCVKYYFTSPITRTNQDLRVHLRFLKPLLLSGMLWLSVLQDGTACCKGRPTRRNRS